MARLWGRPAPAPAGRQAGAQEQEQEREILKALEVLRDTTVREVMTPRVDLTALSAPVTVGDVARAVRESGHSRFPVYEDSLDNLVGVLFVKDLFRSSWREIQTDPGPATVLVGAEAEGPPLLSRAPVRKLRKPFLVPEARHVLDVLAAMRQRRNAFAVVVDEYGGVEGVVTVKDLVSELVGELPDEFDQPEEEDVVRVDAGRWLVAGDTQIFDLKEEIGLDLPEGEYVTLGGFLFDRLGHIPEEGETLLFQGWELRVTEMDRRRIAQVVIRAPSSTLDGAGEPAAGK